MRRPAGGQWQRRNAKQQDEQNREALLPEDAREVAQRLVPIAGEPAFELVAQLLGALLSSWTHDSLRYPAARSSATTSRSWRSNASRRWSSSRSRRCPSSPARRIAISWRALASRLTAASVGVEAAVTSVSAYSATVMATGTPFGCQSRSGRTPRSTDAR